MGLDVSHDAFHGSYNEFNRFRQVISWVTGGSCPPHWLYNKDGTFLRDDKGDVIYDTSLDNNLIYFGDNVNEKDTPGLVAFCYIAIVMARYRQRCVQR